MPDYANVFGAGAGDPIIPADVSPMSAEGQDATPPAARPLDRFAILRQAHEWGLPAAFCPEPLAGLDPAGGLHPAPEVR